MWRAMVKPRNPTLLLRNARHHRLTRPPPRAQRAHSTAYPPHPHQRRINPHPSTPRAPSGRCWSGRFSGRRLPPLTHFKRTTLRRFLQTRPSPSAQCRHRDACAVHAPAARRRDEERVRARERDSASGGSGVGDGDEYVFSLTLLPLLLYLTMTPSHFRSAHTYTYHWATLQRTRTHSHSSSPPPLTPAPPSPYSCPSLPLLLPLPPLTPAPPSPYSCPCPSPSLFPLPLLPFLTASILLTPCSHTTPQVQVEANSPHCK
ncbi:hypothetical protein B0H19DRAFT_524896 [Mycena capillaripes]|nr:hypothetical protein B0H19DRAFT_524896 [Mycena capillaripes]